MSKDSRDGMIRSLRMRNDVLSRQIELLREHDKQLTWMIDRLYRHVPEASNYTPQTAVNNFTGLTFVIAAYNIPRQLQRTLKTLSPAYQGVPPGKLEVIIIDNGSEPPLTKDRLADFPFVSQIIRVEGEPSPVRGLNLGIRAARHSTIALMIDGAHLLTPGIVRTVGEVVSLMPRPVINVPQFILGGISQNLVTAEDAFERESAELRRLGWPENGYALFQYAVVAGEGQHRDYLHAIESNCLVTTKEILDQSGGFDERFDEPGAGFANLELFHRLVHDPKNEYVALPGEGSFHQDHSGTTTSLDPTARELKVRQYREKYLAITGDANPMTLRNPFLYGVATGTARKVPTISLEFGRARDRILRQLADFYVQTALHGTTGKTPRLVFGESDSDEHVIRPVLNPAGLATAAAARNGVEESALGYRRVLKMIHQELQPRLYFEIGVDNGDSINLAQCPRVGVDPSCEITCSLNYPTRIYRQTSDKFFQNEKLCKRIFKSPVDLAFIDGMHLSEFVLRDFLNIEKWASKDCVVMLDDVLPEQMEMAGRERPFNAWCGDVYKFVLVIKQHRPDLAVNVFETFAGPYRKGLAIIHKLDSENSTLRDRYAEIATLLTGNDYDVTSIQDLEERLQPRPLAELNDLLSKIALARS